MHFDKLSHCNYAINYLRDLGNQSLRVQINPEDVGKHKTTSCFSVLLSIHSKTTRKKRLLNFHSTNNTNI